jgi:cbb3-type cytochrome oxidase subunit 3
MKERMKWIVAGFGFIVGIQLLTTLMFQLLLAQTPSTVQGNQWMVVIFGLTLGAFLVGGFVIGRVEMAPRIFDALVAAVAVLIFSAIVYFALPGSGEKFTGSIWLDDVSGRAAPLWLSTLQMLPALGASVVGAYLGYLMTSPMESVLERFIGLIGIALATGGIVVVYVISSMMLPWYLTAILITAIVLGIAFSYWLFKRSERSAEEMAILPEHRTEQHS